MCRKSQHPCERWNEDVPEPEADQPKNSAQPNFEAVRLAAHVRRQELGLSLKQLVKRSGIAESTVTGALYGYHEGSVRTWFFIARALDVTIGDLLNHLHDDNITVQSTRTRK